MVYVVIDPSVGPEAVTAARASGASLWVGSDVLSPAEQQQLRASGLDLSVFSYSLRDVTPEVMSSTLATIEEHHPGELIWVQLV